MRTVSFSGLYCLLALFGFILINDFSNRTDYSSRLCHEQRSMVSMANEDTSGVTVGSPFSWTADRWHKICTSHFGKTGDSGSLELLPLAREHRVYSVLSVLKEPLLRFLIFLHCHTGASLCTLSVGLGTWRNHRTFPKKCTRLPFFSSK